MKWTINLTDMRRTKTEKGDLGEDNRDHQPRNSSCLFTQKGAVQYGAEAPGVI